MERFLGYASLLVASRRLGLAATLNVRQVDQSPCHSFPTKNLSKNDRDESKNKNNGDPQVNQSIPRGRQLAEGWAWDLGLTTCFSLSLLFQPPRFHP